MNILYIILKHVIWRFQIYYLFREIFIFREDKSNNVLREILKCFRKTAKFERPSLNLLLLIQIIINNSPEIKDMLKIFSFRRIRRQVYMGILRG